MNKNLIVHKEKSLVNAIYKLTLDEQRLLNFAIGKVNPFKHYFGNYYIIGVKDVADFYGLSSGNDYQCFYEALDRLFNRQCTYWSEKLQKFVTCRLIVDKANDMKGTIGIRFSDQMEKMIHSDKDFLSYKLKQTIGITSPNANRLYEILLYSLQRCPSNKLTKNINIMYLKELMGLSEKYSQFTDFKKYVLDVCKKQISKETDIRITYEVIKVGRTPTEIKFSAQYKKGQNNGTLETQDEMTLEEIGKPNDYEMKKAGKEALKRIKSSLA